MSSYRNVKARWRFGFPQTRCACRRGSPVGHADLLHMLRHSTGFELANDGQDIRAIQYYLGYKNIQHTVLYTQLAADRFNDFWED